MSPGAADLRWSPTWEDDVDDGEHIALAGLFAGCFPRSRTPFTGARSWSSGRPELRVIGWHGGRPVARLGILRRFLRVAEQDASQLVGDVGLVAVDPTCRAAGSAPSCSPGRRRPCAPLISRSAS